MGAPPIPMALRIGESRRCAATDDVRIRLDLSGCPVGSALRHLRPSIPSYRPITFPPHSHLPPPVSVFQAGAGSRILKA